MSDSDSFKRLDGNRLPENIGEEKSLTDLSRLNLLKVFGSDPDSLRRLPTFIKVGPKADTLEAIRRIFVASDFSTTHPVCVDTDFFDRLLQESEVVRISEITLGEDSEYRFIRSENREALFCLTGNGDLIQLVEGR